MKAEAFRAAMGALPEPADGAAPEWAHWRHELWELGRAQAPAGFMNWPPIYHTMLVNHWSMDYQLSELQAADWARFEPAVRATRHSSEADRQPETDWSKNLINEAYHVLTWERCTGRRLDELKSIAEIGGGYGALCLVARRLGFRGRYTIYDLPEFAVLQRWFLGECGVKARCTTVLPEAPERCDLLVGIYSLSEMLFEERTAMLRAWPAGSYLLVYSHEWQAYHNREFFAGWAATRQGYRWWDWRMSRENDRPDYYRVGVKA